MKILIVEDRKDKQTDIKKVIFSKYKQKIKVDTASNYFSAKKKVFAEKNFLMLIVDMFLPDAKDDDELKGLAGKDLIFDMYSEGISIPTLVMTQYTDYDNNSLLERDEKRLQKGFLINPHYGTELPDKVNEAFDPTNFVGLHEYLSSEIPFYLGIIYYSNQYKEWEVNLLNLIDRLLRDGSYENITTG